MHTIFCVSATVHAQTTSLNISSPSYVASVKSKLNKSRSFHIQSMVGKLFLDGLYHWLLDFMLFSVYSTSNLHLFRCLELIFERSTISPLINSSPCHPQAGTIPFVMHQNGQEL